MRRSHAVVVPGAAPRCRAPDGTGLTIDGATLDYEGTFTSPSDDEMPGSVSVTCG